LLLTVFTPREIVGRGPQGPKGDTGATGPTGPAGGFGTQLDYVEGAGNVTVSSTTSASPTNVLSGNSVSYDGSTRIEIKFSAPMWDVDTDASGFLHLYEDSTDLGRIAQIVGFASGATTAYVGSPVERSTFRTPAAGNHTYHVKAHKSGGNVIVYDGAGGADTAFTHMYLRIVTAN
jgi:hypothetical protein